MLKERWKALSARERLLIGLAGVAVLAVLARYSPYSPFGGFSLDRGGETWVQVQKIENYQRILARSAAARKQGEALRARYAKVQERLVGGTSPTQVGAELQGQLGTMAADAGLNVLSSQILKQEDADGFHRAGVRLTLSGNLQGVARMLSSIETGNLDLAVTLLEINRRLGASRRPVSTRIQSSRLPAAPLTATMEVKTFMQEGL